MSTEIAEVVFSERDSRLSIKGFIIKCRRRGVGKGFVNGNHVKISLIIGEAWIKISAISSIRRLF